jgi:sec-independent protein translocase protein TatC
LSRREGRGRAAGISAIIWGMAKVKKKVEQEEMDSHPGEEPVRMSFGEHLDELRKRIIRALMGGIIGVGICVYFMFDIYKFVVHPYMVTAARHGLPEAMTTLKPQEAFFTFLTLAVKAGLILTSPWIIWQLWQFVAAGLYKKEKRVVYRYVGPSVVLFLVGVAFFYFIVLPLTLEFFFTFSMHAGGATGEPNWWDRTLSRLVEKAPIPVPPATTTATRPEGGGLEVKGLMIPSLDHNPPVPPEGQAVMFYHAVERRVKILLHDQTMVPMVVAEGALIINTWRSDDYLNFVAFTALIFGLSFELPMVMLVLAQINIVRAKTYRGARKYAYFGIVVGSVIVAPSGDILTLAFLFVPLVVLYEVGILAAAFVTRGRAEED